MSGHSACRVGSWWPVILKAAQATYKLGDKAKKGWCLYFLSIFLSLSFVEMPCYLGDVEAISLRKPPS